MTSSLSFPKGYSDFQKLREQRCYYVDKSLFIDEVLRDSAEIMLLPRPRRFGKTLNLSMLRYFFEKSPHERRSLFQGLKIEQVESAWKHFQRYPTIFITFKDVKSKTWEDTFQKTKKLIADLYREHSALLHSEALSALEKEEFQALLQQKGSNTDLSNSLHTLCRMLHHVHGERVMLLIDEYDTPIHEAYTNGYYNEAIAFFRGLLSAALKDNVHAARGVMTGILRIARESIFSGLNNLGVYSLTSTKFADHFGFTEDEVHELVNVVGKPELLASLRSWYNGYLFGGRTVYNPWSVVHYLEAPADGFRAYWVNTSENAMLRTHVLSSTNDLKPEFEQLLHGEGLDKPIYETITMPDLMRDGDMVWNLLLFSGYLKPEALYMKENEMWARLVIPNLEVQQTLNRMVKTWFNDTIGTSSEVQRLLKAILQGEAREAQSVLQRIVRDNASYHDTQEQFFHGLVLGLLVNLSESHEVHSNRESGFGRCDVLINPKQPGRVGLAIEFKVVDTEYHETMKQALESAMKQLRDRDYAASLRERGASPLYLMAIAFEGKRVELQFEREG